jgi:hypothetical protein
MKVKRVVGMVGIIGLCFSTVTWAAEKDANAPAAENSSMPAPIAGTRQPEMKRPALLPAMYAGFVATQAWDLYTTSAALKNGAYEANPIAASFAGNNAKMIGLKAATTASTIFFVERMWKRNRVGAVVLLAAINGATAAVAMHNAGNARVRR